MIITENLLVQGCSGHGGWNARQFKLLGINWPPKEGWKNKVIGNYIEDSLAEEFIKLKGMSKKRMRSDYFQLSLNMDLEYKSAVDRED